MNFQFSVSNLQDKGGYAALTTTLLVMVVSLSIIGSLTFFSLREVATNRTYTKSVESKYISESGIEDAVYRIVTGKQIEAQESLGVGTGSTTVIVSTVGNQKIIRSEGKRDTVQQNLEIKLDVPASPNVSFNYGAQVGSGGVEMSNNSEIQGSVYSNGPIRGPASGSNVLITGNAFAAGTSAIGHVTINGDARANDLDDNVIGGTASSTTDLCCVIEGNAYANRLKGAVVGTNPLVNEARANILEEAVVNGKCYYQTQGDSVCLGGEFPGVPMAPPPNLTPLDLPIPDSQINQWKIDAAAGGTINGDYSVTSNVSLGPKKITGDLFLNSNNKTLTVTGIIYVQGKVDISNGSIIKCATSYGARSCLILSDDWIHLSNNGQFGGSGTPGSFLMLLSTSAGGGHHGSAIDLHNNATGAIFYAGNGLVYLHNNVTVTNLVANQISLQNGAKIIYDTALENVDFGTSGGGGGSFNVKYWREVE